MLLYTVFSSCLEYILFQPLSVFRSGSRGSIAAPQPPQNRACPSPSTRLKHITNTTLPHAHLALIVAECCFSLSAALGHRILDSHPWLVSMPHGFADGRRDELEPGCCSCLFTLSPYHAAAGFAFPLR